jgi:hypothetical protein
MEEIIKETDGTNIVYTLFVNGKKVCGAKVLPYSLLLDITTTQGEEGKGYGKKLLAYIEKIAKKNNVVTMKTDEIDPCAWKTVSFFKSMGYRFNLIEGDEGKFIEATKRLSDKDNPLDKIVNKEDAKFLAETNRDFLIFYAILFFTCVTAMIELSPFVGYASNSISTADFVYGLLLVGLALSIIQGMATHRSNISINLSGKLGSEIQAYEETRLNTNWYGKIVYHLTNKWVRSALTLSALLVFIFLPYAM